MTLLDRKRVEKVATCPMRHLCMFVPIVRASRSVVCSRLSATRLRCSRGAGSCLSALGWFDVSLLPCVVLFPLDAKKSFC